MCTVIAAVVSVKYTETCLVGGLFHPNTQPTNTGCFDAGIRAYTINTGRECVHCDSCSAGRAIHINVSGWWTISPIQILQPTSTGWFDAGIRA